MKASTLLLPTFALLFAAPLAAEVSAVYRDWASGPVSHLFTPADRNAWAKVTNDEEADLFVRLFWARRDPDKATPENELKQEFDSRVAYAEQHFAATDLSGSMSDRGHTMAVFGPPYRVARPSSGGSAEGGDVGDFGSPVGSAGASGGGPGQFGTGGTADRRGVVSQEIWTYEKDRKPKTLTKKRLEIRFKTQPGTDRMVFAKADEVLGLLSAEAAALVLYPELSEADLEAAAAAAVAAREPKPWQAEAADPTLVAALRAKAAEAAAAAPIVPTPAATTLDAGVFQAYDGAWETPFQVSLPAASLAGQRLVAEITDDSGTSVMAFVSTSTWETFGNRAVIQSNATLHQGTYTLTAGLIDSQGQVTWAASDKLVVPAHHATDFWMSELILSDNIYGMQEAQKDLLEPFTWGAVSVVPKGDDTFAQNTSLWLYAHVCNAKTSPDGKPTLRTVVLLEGPRRARAPLPIEASKANERCWVLGQALDLLADTFPPGQYQVTLEVTDTLAVDADHPNGIKASAGRSFTVVAP